MLFDRLPRELRDMIYNHYTTEDGGYHFDSESGKLRTKSGDKIELSLMYSCKSIASEMRGLHLQNNTIHFTTTTLTTERFNTRTRHHGHLFDNLHMVNILLLPCAREFIDDNIARTISEQFPRSEVLMKHLMNTNVRIHEWSELLDDSGVWGQAPSFYRETIAELLRLVARVPRFGEISRKVLERHGFQFAPGQDALSLHSLHPKPWKFPTDHEIESMEKLLPSGRHNPFREHVRDRTKYYVSAASQALTFLPQLPQHLRTSIRSIDLHDTHASVSHPECHARALIHFAIENPKLKIVYRVDLLGAVLTSLQSARYEEYRSDLRQGLALMRTFFGTDVTRTVALWMMEALALESAGMPPGSFTLIFEGEGDLMQPIFDIVIEDAAWQEALQSWPGRHIIPYFETGYENYPCYFFAGFPDLMRDSLTGTGAVRFNNCSNWHWDIDELLQANSECSGMADWYHKWAKVRSHDIVPPLPYTWDAILPDYVQEGEVAPTAVRVLVRSQPRTAQNNSAPGMISS